MNQKPKIFALEEANALLPELEGLLAELDEKQETFRRLQDRLFFEELLEDVSPPDEEIRQMEARLMELEKEIQRIRELGCLLRHAEKGLVDFLSKRGEEWVYFCWRRGEKQIEFYHTLRGGFFERQKI
jgi:hypothetical protein